MKNEQITGKPGISKITGENQATHVLHYLFILMKIFVVVLLVGFIPASTITIQELTGAWRLKSGASDEVLIFEEGYFTHTGYDKAKKTFHYTKGGPVDIRNDSLFVRLEFHSAATNEIGKSFATKIIFDQGELTTNWNGVRQQWTRIDKGEKPLSGYWAINGRMQEDKMIPITPGARKTIKILSGTRFQWAAINSETKEFFGTGGGVYSFADGKYTEKIEFFSRDSSRVGATLVFDGKLENGVWHHSGLSSKGDPIKETWIRFNP